MDEWNTGDEQRDLLFRCGVALRKYEKLLRDNANMDYPFGKDIEQKVSALIEKEQA